MASVPGAGSSFVLVLPGVADASELDIRTALATTLEHEEVNLEERIVRRAIDAMWADADAERGPNGRDVAVLAARRAGSGRLRALPSIAPGGRGPA